MSCVGAPRTREGTPDEASLVLSKEGIIFLNLLAMLFLMQPKTPFSLLVAAEQI